MSEVAATPSAAPDLLARARKEASAALFTLAVLQLAFTALAALLPRLLGATVDPAAMALALGWSAGLSAVYAGLGVWARFQPLPAAAVGLGLFTVLTLLTLVPAADHFGKGSAVQLLVQLVLAALLVKAIRTGWVAKRTPVHHCSSPAGRVGSEVVGGAQGPPGADL